MVEALILYAPPLVMHVPCLEVDLKALLELTEPLVPPERAVRSKHLLQVCHEGFGGIVLLDGIMEWELVSWKELY
jgi:hypothetical protein